MLFSLLLWAQEGDKGGGGQPHSQHPPQPPPPSPTPVYGDLPDPARFNDLESLKTLSKEIASMDNSSQNPCC